MKNKVMMTTTTSTNSSSKGGQEEAAEDQGYVHVIEEISSILTEHLVNQYPTGPPVDEYQIKQWLIELIESNIIQDQEQKFQSSSSTTTITKLIIEKAIPIAVGKWKTITNDKMTTTSTTTKQNDKNKKKATTPTSFSIFDQLGGNFSLTLPVSIETLLDTSTTDKERLNLIQKIDHIDDIMPDWNDVKLILSNGLNDCSYWIEYLQLHLKWFDQCRVSTEYLSLQYDLCRNVLNSIQTYISSTLEGEEKQQQQEEEEEKKKSTSSPTEHDGKIMTIDDNHLLHLIQTWRDMWLDLMQRGLYHKESAADIELSMLFLLRNMVVVGREELSSTNDTNDDTSAMLVLPMHVLALIDNKAKWFESWTKHVSIERLVALLESSGIISSLESQCTMTTTTATTTTTSLDQKVTTNTTSSTSSNPQMAVVKYAMRIQSLAILRCILISTRVIHFPWRLLNQPNILLRSTEILTLKNSSIPITTENNDSTLESSSSLSPNIEQIQKLLNIFLSGLYYESQIDNNNNNNNDDECIRICIDAIKTILSGIHVNNHQNDMLLLSSSKVLTIRHNVRNQLRTQIHKEDQSNKEGGLLRKTLFEALYQDLERSKLI